METETKIDNKLIAEFMGEEVFLYNEWWDQLMRVVIAIEDLEEPHPSNDPTKGAVWPYHVEILSRSVVQIIDNRSDESIVLVDDQHHRKIDSVYKAVLEFIKWYNNQKENGNRNS